MDRLGHSIAMIVAAILAGVGTAWSDKGEDKEPSKTEMAAAAKVPIDQAIKAASDKANGKIIEAELGWEGGRLVWEVEIVTPEGKTVKVHVDADTGQILDTEGKKPGKKKRKKQKAGK